MQQRWSDGETRPIGRLYASQDDLLDDAELLFDGETYGMERRVVRAQRLPESGRDLLN